MDSAGGGGTKICDSARIINTIPQTLLYARSNLASSRSQLYEPMVFAHTHTIRHYWHI